MKGGELMGQITSVGEIPVSSQARTSVTVLTVLEILLVYAGILAYIWRWQYTFPQMWMALLAVILTSQILHRDTLRGLGLLSTELGASARLALPVTILICLPMLLYGFIRHSLVFVPPTWPSLVILMGYGMWCVVRQYLTQSYFHNRLMLIIRNRHVSSVVIGFMFGSTHIPNPILTPVTALAGFIFAEIFARHKNIWPLALAQAVGGLLLATVAPDALIHHMRVGPGYFFFQVR